MLQTRSLKIFRDNKLKTAAVDTPITLAEAKAQLNIESAFTDDDTLITSQISTATELLQDRTQVQLMQATWQLVMNNWDYDRDHYLELPWSPLVTLSSVKYYDSNNAEQTWNSSNYQVYNYGMPGKVRFVEGLPELYDRPDAVILEYIAGYGASGASGAAQQAAIPARAKDIIKILVADLYENRTLDYKKTDRLESLMSTMKVFLKQ